VTDRVPPQNIAAEQSVLGGIIVRNELMDVVANIITSSDFYRSSHGRIWQVMESLRRAGRPIDEVTLLDALRAEIDAVGGVGYIAELVATPPVIGEVPHYAAIVKERSIQRRLGEYGHALGAKAYNPPPQWSPEFTEELLACAEHDLAQIASIAVRKPEKTARELFATALYNLEHRIGGGISTGFRPVDQVFGGLLAGHITTVGARTSKGKTAFACNVAINVAKTGSPVVYFTLEMCADEMLLRALGTEAMVDTFAIQQRGYRGVEQERVEEARRILEPLPLRYVYLPGMQPRELRLECKRVVREMGGLKLAMIDYVNLMRGDQRQKERWTEMRELVVRLKEIAGELGIPLLVLSQLNREVGEYEKPSLGHLRDTGAAEEHSSNVLFLWEPKPAEAGSNGSPRIAFDGWTNCKLTIAKQRNGPAGMDIPMRFKKSWGKFEAP
jgi:replicative DNA helicase